MLNRLLAGVLVLFLGCSCAGSPYRAAAPVPDILDATAMLVSRDSTGEIDGECAAVWVGQVDLLTAGHCARDLSDGPAPDPLLALLGIEEDPIGRQVEYATHKHPNRYQKAVVVAYDGEHDLALLSARRDLDHGVATVYQGVIALGMPTMTAGHTLGMAYSVSAGVVGGDRKVERLPGHEVHVLQVTGSANFGDSGGGAWTMNGELLGIGSFRSAKSSSILFYVHRDETLAFLKREAVL